MPMLPRGNYGNITDQSPDGRFHGQGGREVISHTGSRNSSRVTKGKDPPGQFCRYIPPGDHRNERYRLSTFSHFPETPMKIFDLTRAGFYYTGYNDQTKCFSCGVSVEGWTRNDSPFDSRWHELDCPMAQGRDLRNVESDSTRFHNVLMQCSSSTNPKRSDNAVVTRNYNYESATNGNASQGVDHVTTSISRFQIDDRLPNLILAQVVDAVHEMLLGTLSLNKEEDRRKTFAKWPSYPAPYLPSNLAEEGFFYLGNLDRTQCFSCSGVLRNWAPSDNIAEQHRKHFPNCRLHSGSEPRNVPMSYGERRKADDEDRQKLTTLQPSGDVSEPPDPSAAEQIHLQRYVPCDRPLNPHMSSLPNRIDSFLRWPAGKTKATPEQMAKAGLFYLGEGDKTKCFYCNGGLQNYDYNDEPWTEHAKWFPGCPFIIRQKGVQFVRNIMESHPNLNRPSIRNGISLNDIPRFQPSPSQGACGSAATALPMETQIGQPSIPAYEPPTKRSMLPNDSVQAKRSRSTDEDTARHSELQKLKDSLLCKSCRSRKADTVLLPCGHAIACHGCASGMKKCVLCHMTITEFMRVYRA